MCTGIRFTDAQNNLFFGRNLDVEQEYGEKVIVTPRNFHFPMKHMEDLTVKRAIIGMGISVPGLPLYFDCANEDGLCIAGLNFPGNAYFIDEPVEGKTNITPYEFMVWAVSEFTNVADLKKALENVCLVNTPVAPSMPVAPLHWIISDSKETITVEQTKAGLNVYENKVHVMTNNPEFPWQVTNLNNYLGLTNNDKEPTKWSDQELKAFGVGTGGFGLPGDSTPPSRFVRAAYLVHSYPQVEGETANVAKFFNILKNVAMPLGTVTNVHGQDEWTVYSSCYSVATKTYYYDRHNDFNTKAYTLNDENINASDLVIYE